MTTFKNAKEYRENTPLKEQEAFAKELQTWLGYYTDEVFLRVMKKFDEIINNEFALNMIHELHEREMKEKKEEINTILFTVGHTNEEDYTPHLHNHPLEHSKSYRDILHDMFIKQ